MIPNRQTLPPILMGALVALLLAFPADLVAQDQESQQGSVVEAVSTAKVEDVGERGLAVLLRMDEILQGAGRFEEQLVAASGEDSMVIRLQRARFRDQFMVLGVFYPKK